MKKWILGIIAIVFLLGGYFVASPYMAAASLRDAIKNGDADRIESLVDFPSVRESLKSQMTMALTEKMQSDPEMADNPFAGLAAIMAPAIVDKAIDVYITPGGLAKVIDGKKPSEEENKEGAPAPEFSTHWVSLGRFRVSPKLEAKADTPIPPSLLFEREGFASWQLIRLELPDSMFEEPERKLP